MAKKVAIIGAGPAGLTAAYLLGKAAQEVTVFEKDPQYVGGISRTESYKG
ncbi:MAG: UDP-galactopyranose mutase, partial [Bacteroidota bacterium]